jgi:hypothetical protein
MDIAPRSVILTAGSKPTGKGWPVATIDKKMFKAEVDNLRAIIDAVRAQQGSAAERHRNATYQALGEDVAFAVNDMPAPPDVVEGNEGTGIAYVNLGDLASFVKSLGDWAEQVANEAVTKILKASTDDSNLDALRTQYAEKKEYVEALGVVLGTMKIDVSDVVIPQLRGTKSAGGTRKSAKTSHGQWYRVVDGMRKPQADSQNNISAFAFYHGASLMGIKGEAGTSNNGKGVSKDMLEKFLTDNVTDSPLGKSWSYERDGVTYGMDVKSADDKPSTDEEE